MRSTTWIYLACPLLGTQPGEESRISTKKWAIAVTLAYGQISTFRLMEAFSS